MLAHEIAQICMRLVAMPFLFRAGSVFYQE